MRAYHQRKERFACLVAHRRFGKTVGAINDLIRIAMTCPLESPRVAYIAPYYSQAKAIAWDYAKHYTANIPGVVINVSELRIDFPNGGRLRLFGADNYDAMRGLYFDAVVLDEPADFPANAWPTVIRPALADRKGRATFIGTPKGKNEFWQIAEHARRDADWYYGLFKASETGILDDEELSDARKLMGEDRYLQEFECSFEAALQGAYYGVEMRKATEDKRIARVPYDPALQVVTSWDLGIGDSTAIWFAQFHGAEKRIIDYYENSGVGLDHYVKVLREKGYLYDQHILPHDAQVSELGTGKTRIETLRALGLDNIAIAPKLMVDDGIQAVRMFLATCWFDEDKCERGLEALRQYQRDWDDKGKTWRGRPRHDWTSHGCLAAGELVETERGMVPVEDVVAGDRVVTPIGLANVEWAGMVKRASELIRITLDDGKVLTLTPEHKVFTTRGVVAADTLRYDDAVIIAKDAACLRLERASKMGYRAAFSESFGGCGIGGGQSGVFTSRKSAESSDYFTERHSGVALARLSRPMAIGMTFGLITGSRALATPGATCHQSMTARNSLASNTTGCQTAAIIRGAIRALNICTAPFGGITTGRSLMVGTSITSTATRQTTVSRTFKQSRQPIISQCMPEKASGLEVNATRKNCGSLANWRALGIQARKAASGILKMVRPFGQPVNGMTQRAKSAAENIRPHSQTGQNIAAGIAGLKRFAADVPVYDLTVTHHHCYYANGMLVSNSDSFRYLATGYKGAKANWGGPLRRNVKGIA